jgi:hypothetical protein
MATVMRISGCALVKSPVFVGECAGLVKCAHSGGEELPEVKGRAIRDAARRRNIIFGDWMPES